MLFYSFLLRQADAAHAFAPFPGLRGLARASILITLAEPLLVGAGLGLGWRVGALTGVALALALAALGTAVSAIGVIVGIARVSAP